MNGQVNGQMSPNWAARFDDAAGEIVVKESACDVDERSPARIAREMSRYSEGKFDSKSQYSLNRCGARGS